MSRRNGHCRAGRRLVGIALLLATACSSVQLVEVKDIDTLFFGTSYPGGAVSDAEWRAFADEFITPRFPGFTEWSATGHWEGARESTHVVEIVHLHRSDNERKIAEIIAAYKARFQQEAVYWVRERGLAEPR